LRTAVGVIENRVQEISDFVADCQFAMIEKHAMGSLLSDARVIHLKPTACLATQRNATRLAVGLSRDEFRCTVM
jgi:hypothetical protein